MAKANELVIQRAIPGLDRLGVRARAVLLKSRFISVDTASCRSYARVELERAALCARIAGALVAR
jgi:hypothetical protein